MNSNAEIEYEKRNAIIDEIIKFGNSDKQDYNVLQKNIDKVCKKFETQTSSSLATYSYLTTKLKSLDSFDDFDAWKAEQRKQIEELEKDLPEFKKDK